MRKSITLCPKLQEIVSKSAKVWHYPESVIINYCVSKCLNVHRLSDFDSFGDDLEIFYRYYVKVLPRGKKAKGGKNA